MCTLKWKYWSVEIKAQYSKLIVGKYTSTFITITSRDFVNKTT